MSENLRQCIFKNFVLHKTRLLISSAHYVRYCSKCFINITNLIFKQDYKCYSHNAMLTLSIAVKVRLLTLIEIHIQLKYPHTI